MSEPSLQAGWARRRAARPRPRRAAPRRGRTRRSQSPGSRTCGQSSPKRSGEAAGGRAQRQPWSHASPASDPPSSGKDGHAGAACHDQERPRGVEAGRGRSPLLRARAGSGIRALPLSQTNTSSIMWGAREITYLGRSGAASCSRVADQSERQQERRASAYRVHSRPQAAIEGLGLRPQRAGSRACGRASPRPDAKPSPPALAFTRGYRERSRWEGRRDHVPL